MAKSFRNHPALEPLLLLAITLIALALRLYRLGAWSLWGDEEFTLRFTADGFRTPLSSGLIFILTRAMGVSEWSARLGPALIGVATVPLLYLPVRRGFGKPVALVFSLLLALSTWHIYWSQNVRFYTALLLLFSLALFYFHFGLEEDRPGFMLASLIFLGLAANERLLALFFVPIVAAYLGLLWLLRPARLTYPPGLRLRNLAIYLVPGLLVTIFFVGPYLVSLDHWFVNFGDVGNTPAQIVISIVYYTSLPIVVLGAFGALHQLLRRSRAALLFGLAAVTPVLALTALAPFQYTANRYAFVSLTSWLLLASLTLVEIFKLSTGSGRILAVGVLALVVTLSLSEDVLYFQYQNGNREDARAAFQYIAAHRDPADVVVAPNRQLGRFYLRDGPLFGLSNYDFKTIPPGVERIWIVEDSSVAGKMPHQYAWIQANAKLVANFDVYIHGRGFLMRVYVYTVHSPPGS